MSVHWVGLSGLIQECHYHSHATWEIVLNISGRGTAHIDGKDYGFAPGYIYCIPPYTLHSKKSEAGFQDFFLHTDQFLPAGDRKELGIFRDDEEKSIESLMMMAHRIFHKKENNMLPVVNALASSIGQLLLSWSDRKQTNEGVELLKNEIIRHFTNPEFRATDALQNAAYSKDYLRRRFKEDTSWTPAGYLMELRLGYAADLLEQKKTMGFTVAEVAYMAGFYDARYFSRAFKRKTGLSPEQYAARSVHRPQEQGFDVEKMD